LRLGRGIDDVAVQAATDLLRRNRGQPATVSSFPAAKIASEHLWIVATMLDDFPTARAALLAEEAELDAMGWDRPRTIALSDLSMVESWMGDLDAADGHSRMAREMVEADDASPYALATTLLATAQVAAIRGDSDTARSMLDQALEARPVAIDPDLSARVLALRGFVELSDGRIDEAGALDRVAAIVAAGFDREPADLRHEGDRIEVLLARGDVEGARAIVADLERRRAVVDRPWLAVMVARGRSLLAAAQGDPAGALAELAPDDELHERLAMPLERARTWLAAGRIRRRLREKRRAREAFEMAREIFQRIGARQWAAIADAELARTGRRPASSLELTETERRVAELAAHGGTNREVGRALFLSPKSVDGVLVRIYQKLGIHSRAELGARLGGPSNDARPAFRQSSDQ
jgi:ATP/maltotriose-dependent transcriptional regulator MalT